MAEIRKATLTDAASLAPRLGYGDLIEVYALGFMPFEGLKNALLTAKEAWVAAVDKRPEVMFGVSKPIALGTTPTAFLLASDNVPKFEFIRVAKYVSENWSIQYPDLRAFVDVRNLRAQRWLGWMGFKPGKIVEAGPYQRPFLTVWLHAASVQPYPRTN